ncbi:MAG: tetratricopeptide repeat protein [Myxococcales bacterium]|nr:tetratricopeptide repeat protein [Myxococcales bacterium]
MVDATSIEEIDKQIAKFESQKRWSDMIRAMVSKAELTESPDQKVDLYLEAGSMYLEKSSNQSEAIKCFEAALEHDPLNPVAIAHLKEMYEKRRDWEKLIAIMTREVEMLETDQRLPMLLEMANLATERLRKPQVCVDLWQKVLELEPDHPEALAHLARLYERGRNWEPLAKVLEQQTQQLTDPAQLVAALQTLGVIYADKLNDDEGSMRVFRRILDIEPDDRRAQEQLKKRYTALKRWDDLEGFFASSERWDELIRVFEREAEAPTASAEDKALLLLRSARLWETKKQKPDRAARVYEKILTLDANNLDAATALTPIYENAGDSKKLAHVYEIRIAHSHDTEELLFLLREAGLLYEQKLKDPHKAFEKFLAAFGLDPAREVLREDVERLVSQVDGWEKLVEVYRGAIESVTEHQALSDLRLGYGRVLGSLGRTDEAILQYHQVYSDQPENTLAMAALERLHKEKGNYEELLRIQERRAELESEPEARRKLAYDRASLLENELGDPDRAIESYLEILHTFGPDEADAYAALERLYQRTERWAELATLLEQRIDTEFSDDKLADLKTRLAFVTDRHLREGPRAVEIYREVLTLVPSHEGAREALERMLAEGRYAYEAAQVLEPIYETRGDFSALVGALRVQQAEIDNVAERLDLTNRIAQIYTLQLGDSRKAFDTYIEALSYVPEDTPTLGRLEMLASEQNRFAELVLALSNIARRSEDVSVKRACWLRAAQLQDTQLQDLEAAIVSYSHILEIDPADTQVLEALESLHRRAERWGDLLPVLRQRADLSTDIREKEVFLSEMAAIYDRRLGQPAEAVGCYRTLLESDPTNMRALTALDELYERQEAWPDLAENIERHVMLADSAQEQIELMLRLANLRVTRLNAVEQAIDTYREVLDRDPQNSGALRALEEVAAKYPQHEVTVCEILEPIYRQAGDVHRVIAVHEMQIRHSHGIERTLELLHRIAQLQEDALMDSSGAFQSYARALAADPADVMTQEHLERLAATSGAWEQLAEVYQSQADRLEDPGLVVGLLMKVAEILEHHIRDTDRAIASYQRILDLDKDRVEAASALQRLYESAGRYEELAVITLNKADALTTPEDKKDELFRAADIYETRLGNLPRAVDVYKKILEADAYESRVIDRLIAAYLQLERWEELLAVYTMKADLVSDPHEKKRLLAEVGAVYERELQDLPRAIDVYQRILELDPEDMVAISRLDVLYQSTQNWNELLSVLERQVDLSHDPAEAIAHRFRIAEIWDQRLNDATRAVEGYKDILALQPDHEPSLNALELMIAQNREAREAADVLEPIYRAWPNPAKLAGVMEVQVTHQTDPFARVDLLHQLAEIYELQVGQPEHAFDAYARALEIDAGNEQTLGSLERMAEQLDTWPELTRLYDAEIGRAREKHDATRMVDIALRLARIQEIHVNNAQEAIKRYQVVLEAEPEHREALEALDRLYFSTEQWGALAQILSQELALATDSRDIVYLQLRQAELYWIKLDQPSLAIERYRDILALDPDSAEAVTALEEMLVRDIETIGVAELLEPIYSAREQWGRLVELHQRTLYHQSDPLERVTLEHRIAELYDENMGDSSQAFDWYQKALMEDPLYERSASETDRLARMLDGWATLANTYSEVLEQRRDNLEVVSTAGVKLAQLYESELGDVERAEEAYRFVLGVNPKAEDALESLDRIYTEQGAFKALHDVLKMRIDAVNGSSDGVELNFRLGRLLETELSEPDQAIHVYRRIIDKLDPQHMDAIHALENVYSQKGQWPELLEAYEREYKVAMGDSAQSDVLAKMARLSTDNLHDQERAVDLWRRVLDIRGEDREALAALGDIYARQENWRDLVDVLEREAAVVDDDATRIAIYTDLGRVWSEKLQRNPNALESWERVLDIDPGNVDALFAMAAIQQSAEAYGDVVETLHRLVDVGAAVLSDTVLQDVYLRMGQLYAEKQQQPLEAVEAYTKVLEINPRAFVAMDELERIHREEAQWEAYIGVLEQRANALDDVEAKIGVLLAIGEAWETKADQKDGGVSAYERVLELDPLHQFAFEKLEELHREAGRFEALVELYLVRLERLDVPEERRQLFLRTARVYEKDLNDSERAFDAILVAWTEDYANEEITRELERLAGITQRWNELLSQANDALQQERDPEIRLVLCLRCARWYGTELGHLEYAIPYYEEIRELDPVNVPAMRQLAELYRTTAQWQLLAKILVQLADMTNEPGEKMLRLVELGELCENQLGVPDQAHPYYHQALELETASLEALGKLEHVYQGTQEWEQLLVVLQRTVNELTDPVASVAPRLTMAEVYERELDQKDEAVSAYANVLEIDPGNIQALRGLQRLYTALERWQELREILENQLAFVRTEREKIELYLRLAELWEDQFIKPEQAAEQLEHVVELDPTHHEAYLGLERLYRRIQRWPALIETYDRHAIATPDRDLKVTLFKAMGEVQAHELNDVEKSIDAYLNALDIEGDDVEALEALAEQYVKRGDFNEAINMLDRLADLVADPEKRVALRFRIGQIVAQHLVDANLALQHFENALDIDAGHLPSLEAMRKIYLDMSDWHSAIRILEREVELHHNPRQIAKAYVELGKLYEDKLESPEQAIESYDKAHAQDANNEDAAFPLARAYQAEERWSEAMPLLQLLITTVNKRPVDEQRTLWTMLGQTAAKLKDNDLSSEAYEHAYRLDTTHLPSLIGLAEAHYHKRAWDKAFKHYQMALVHHRDALNAGEITDIFFRLGVIKREQGERRKALNMFDKALEESPGHRRSLEAIVALHEEQKDWERVVHFKKRLLDTADDTEKVDVLQQIGTVWAEQLKQPQKAIESYVEATNIDPNNHRILHKLLAIYQQTKQWQKAVEVIDHISALDDRPESRSKYAYTVGVIYRDELKNPVAALEKFNEALDFDVTQLKAFESINKLLTQKKDWKQLERAFRKMLHRVVGQGNIELEFNLWHNLGVIYRDRMKRLENAAEAFKMASSLQPTSLTEHQILAEIYAMLPGHAANAVQEHQALLNFDPFRVESYKQLYKLYFEEREYDKAWCVSSALVFLQSAEEEHRQFYGQYQAKGMVRPKRRMDEGAWLTLLRHPDEDVLLSGIFETICPALSAIRAGSDKKFGLNKKYLHDPATSTVTFAKTFHFVSQILNITHTPRLFLRPDKPGGLVHVVADPPALLAGSSVLQGFNPQDLTFLVAKHLTYHRPQYYLRKVLETRDELKTALLAAVKICGTGLKDPNVDQWAQEISSRMQPVELERLRKLCKQFVDSGAVTNVKGWSQAIELSACRAGFLLNGSLEVASRLIQAEPPSHPDDLPAKDKVKQVVRFSASEEYFELRKKLGIQIDIS